MTTRPPGSASVSADTTIAPSPAPPAPSAQREFLPFAAPLVGEEEIQEVVETLRTTWITTGPKAKRFEQAFAAYVGGPGALALSSCTAALHTALVTLGIGPGDEVVTTPMTFAASVNVIEHAGARPVLVDVEPDTLNIDPALAATALTARTRAILPVHYAGHPVNLQLIDELASRAGLAVIEDAAHAMSAKYRGRTIGSGSNPAAFSFYPTKNMTTAEGGMLTGDPAFLERARTVSLHGMTRDGWSRYDRGGSWYYEVVFPGFKYNMTDVQAALGLWQLRKLAEFQQRRRTIVQLYNEAFAGEDALELPAHRPDIEHAWHLYVLRLRDGVLRIDRDAFIEDLKRRQIGTSVHFIPIHVHPYYRDKYGYRPDSFPVAFTNYRRMLSLPLSPRMTDADAAYVVSSVLDIVRRYRR